MTVAVVTIDDAWALAGGRVRLGTSSAHDGSQIFGLRHASEMQPVAVSVSWRGFLAAAAVLATVHASNALAPVHWFPALPTLIVPRVPPPLPASVVVDDGDAHWEDANALAVAIENRRWGDIAEAVHAIEPSSPYRPWVPAALELAVEQLDGMASAYARMNMCGELAAFVAQVEQEWPAGREAMQPVTCGRYICGMGRRAMMRDAPRRYALLAGDLAEAIASADHRSALEVCGAMNEYGPIPASCLVQACRAGELAVAEVIAEQLDQQLEPGTAPGDPALLARHACQRVGMALFDGRAYVVPRGDQRPWVAHPAALVRVHPDAPVERATLAELLVEL